jgi:hypothetical protein
MMVYSTTPFLGPVFRGRLQAILWRTYRILCQLGIGSLGLWLHQLQRQLEVDILCPSHLGRCRSHPRFFRRSGDLSA